MKTLLKRKNEGGFLVPDFLFAIVMTVGIGIFIFGITFSLATVEISQYIVWSTARNYAAANVSEVAAREQAEQKFEALVDLFPMLTGSDEGMGLFELSRQDLVIGDLARIDTKFAGELTGDDVANDFRQPWTGVSTTLNLKLFAGLQVPFLGKVAEDKSLFKFPVRAFIIRNVSENECKEFFSLDNRYTKGIKQLENGELASDAFGVDPMNSGILHGEDNGC